MTEAHFHGLLESLLRLEDAVATLDAQARITWASDGWRARAKEFLPRGRGGASVLALCREAPARTWPGLKGLAAGLGQVLSGRRVSVQAEYTSVRAAHGARHWRARVVTGTGGVAALIAVESRGDSARELHLEEVDRTLRQLTAHGPDAITLWDRSGRCLWASAAVQRLFGHTPAAFLRQRRVQWLLPRSARPMLSQLAKLPVGASRSFCVTVARPRPSRAVDVRFHRVSEGPICLVAVAREAEPRLEQERRARVTERLLEETEALAQVGYWVRRPGHAWEWSASLGRAHGLERGAAPSLAAYLQSVHPDDRAEVERLVKRAGAGDVTFRYRRADGLERRLRLRRPPDYEGATVGVMRDVTDELALQQTVVRLFEERAALLRDHFSARDRERRALAQELHDQLGSSLTAMLLTAERLSKESAPKASLRRLAGQARGLFDTVRAVSRALQLSDLDALPLRAALERLVERFREATEAAVSLDYRGPLSAPAPPGLLRVAQECLSNAVRHASAARIRVRCTVDAGEIVLVVEDDGVGIRRKDGHGIGLSGIVRRSESMGGSTHIQSRRGHGTRVEVRVPSLFRGWSSP